MKKSFLNYIRIKILRYRMNKAYKKSKVLYVSKKYRQCGITTELIKIAFRHNLHIYCHDKITEKYIAKIMINYVCGDDMSHQQNLINKSYINNMIISDINQIQGKKINGVVIDNSCTSYDIQDLIKYGVNIKLGVMYK